VEFGEWLCKEVLKAVPHRHFIFSIPKILRRYFLYDRKLLSDLSRCGWESLKNFFNENVSEEDAVPGAVIAIQSFGDFLGFNPHLHILCSDGCFYGEDMFRVTPRFETRQLEEILRYEVFKMLLSKGKITEEQLRAKAYERTEERQGYRNGTYPHRLTTRVGSLILRVPRLRGGKFSTELFSRYQRSEQAFILALMEMVVNGVSTRKVSEITEELCGVRVSRSLVSELCKRLDPVIEAWRDRSLKDKEYPFLIVDALVIRVREDNRVLHRSMLIGVGVNKEGIREVLGFMIGDSESEESWGRFFSWLKDRGLRGVDLVVSDDHKGLVRALRRNFQGASWQRCQTHFIRNILNAAPKSLQGEIKAKVQAILQAPDIETAQVGWWKEISGYDRLLRICSIPAT